MPYPAQIDYDRLVDTAHAMIEADGLDALSMSKVAAAFDVKAASLYKHVKNKAALLRAVNELTLHRLFTAMHAALDDAPQEPRARLLAVALAYRAFAHSAPVTYLLAFSTADPAARPDPDEQEQAALPFQALMAQVSGEADSLPALRGLLALIHGFAALEISNQYRRGGDLDAAFRASVEAYLQGWS